MSGDPQQLKSIKDVGRPEICFAITRVPQSQRIYYGASDSKVYSFDWAAEKPEPQPLEGHSSYVTGVVLGAGHLISGGYDCRLIWRNAESLAIVKTVENAHAKWIRSLIVSPDGQRVISLADDMVAKVWDAATGELVHTLQDHQALTPHHYPSMLFAGTVSADGTLLATGDKVGHVAIWNLATGEKVGSVEAPGLYTWDPVQRRHSIGGIRSLAFSPDNRLIAAGGIGKIGNVDHLVGPTRLEVFDWKAGKKEFETENDKLKGLIERLQFDPDGQWIVGAGGDHGGFINFYNAADGKLIKQEKVGSHVHSFVLNEEADTMYLVAHSKLAIWEFKKQTTA